MSKGTPPVYELWNMAVLALGVAALISQIFLAFRMFRSKNRLARAVGYVFASTAIVCFATLAFAVATSLGHYRTLPFWAIIGLRLAIFGSVAASSINLALVMRRG